MPLSRVTVNLQDIAHGLNFQIVGTSDTLAEAEAEAKAKVGLAGADVEVIGVSRSEALTDFSTYTPFGGASAKGTLVLRKGSDKSTTRSIGLKALSKLFADAIALDGSVDITKAPIVNFGAAYRDADGEGGYSVVRGSYEGS